MARLDGVDGPGSTASQCANVVVGNFFVMARLDRAIQGQPRRCMMDGRVKPGHDA